MNIRINSLSAVLLGTAFCAMSGLVASSVGANAKTLVYCSEGSPEGFDPALYSANGTWDASSETIYDRLTAFKLGTTDIIPSLAKSWTISEDNLEYIISLKNNVKFHSTEYFTPSRNMNADDVLFSFDRQLNKENPWHQYIPEGTWEMFDAMDMGKIIKKIEKIDDHTIRFVLTQPDSSLLAKLALNFGSIMSKEYADKLIEEKQLSDLNSKPVGTGPFKFVSYQQDAVIRYAANDDYWDGRPKIDSLIFAITVDPAVRIQRLKANECQVAVYPAPGDVPALKNDPNLKVMELPGLNVAFLAFNTLTPPFDKLEVRQALNMAVNKKAIIDGAYQGMGQIAKSPLPPSMWGYNDKIEDYSYDPKKAQQMLNAAGVKDLKMKIWAMPVSRPYMPNARRVAEMMQSDLAKVGVTAEVVSYEWGEYLKRSSDKQRDGAVILGATSDNGDPDNLMSYFFSCSAVGSSNKANLCYQPLEELIQKARVISNKEERSRLYQEAQQMVHDRAPWIVLANSTVVLPMSSKIKNYVMDPLGAHRFGKVDIEE